MTKLVHSGGADGADSLFSDIFTQHSYQVIHHSFRGHNVKAKTGQTLIHLKTDLESKENIELLGKLSEYLGRNFPKNEYVKKLLLRNIYQVRDSQLVIGIGQIKSLNSNIVEGGTGYAITLACTYKLPVLFFDQKREKWFFSVENTRFQLLGRRPIFEKLPNVFTAIGSRKLTIDGIKEMSTCFSKRRTDLGLPICSHDY